MRQEKVVRTPSKRLMGTSRKSMAAANRQDIQGTIQSDPYLKELYELIESVKGVGPAIATEILIVTNEFKNINEPKKFACHAGVVPFVYASGQYKGKAKTSNKANKQLKALLHNAGRPVPGDVGYTTFPRN